MPREIQRSTTCWSRRFTSLVVSDGGRCGKNVCGITILYAVEICVSLTALIGAV